MWHYHEKVLGIATYVTMGADDFEKGVQIHTLRNMIARITTRQPSSPSDTQNLCIKCMCASGKEKAQMGGHISYMIVCIYVSKINR